MRRFFGVRGMMAVLAVSTAIVGTSFAPGSMLGAAVVDQPRGPASGDLVSLAELLPDPTIIHPDIARQVRVDLSGMGSLATDLSAARTTEEAAVTAGLQHRRRRAELLVERREARTRLAAAVADTDVAVTELERAKDDLGSFALGTFLGSSALELESFSTETGPSPIPTLAAGAEDVLVGAQRVAVQSLAAAEVKQERIAGEVESIGRELSEALVGIGAADASRDEARAEVARLEPAFEAALRTAPVVGTDFAVVVLDAYYRAALRTAEAKPWCEVRWDQLAGIGKVESRHGAFGGNTVGADGRTDGEILGPVLDGTQFASIPDTDGGRFDLDPVWDRAVGPMQFIPSSWTRYGEDGNGDGEVDPHNMYDAAMAAANHLCGTTGGLGEDTNFQRALLGYNRSVPYGLMVMDFASGYRDTVGLEPTATSLADSRGPNVAAVRAATD